MATQTKLITYDDYRHLPDDGKRYEIIGGELFMTPSSKTIHQRISRKLEFELESYIRKHPSGEIFDAPTDVVLSMTDVVQPDLLYISEERSHIITENNIVEAPDLVVEILSEGTAAIDRNQKKELYEKYGVREYWMVDPDEKTIGQFVLQDETFELKGRWEESETLKSDVISGFSLPLNKIFTTD